MHEHDDTELRYLLTAYLFGDISDEGRQEVEARMEANPDTRAEYERLAATLGTLDSVYGPQAEQAAPYDFEAERRQRVLAAARKQQMTRHQRPFYLRSSFGLAAALLIGLTFIVFMNIESPVEMAMLSKEAEHGNARDRGRYAYDEAAGSEWAPADGARDVEKGEYLDVPLLEDGQRARAYQPRKPSQMKPKLSGAAGGEGARASGGRQGRGNVELQLKRSAPTERSAESATATPQPQLPAREDKGLDEQASMRSLREASKKRVEPTKNAPHTNQTESPPASTGVAANSRNPARGGLAAGGRDLEFQYSTGGSNTATPPTAGRPMNAPPVMADPRSPAVDAPTYTLSFGANDAQDFEADEEETINFYGSTFADSEDALDRADIAPEPSTNRRARAELAAKPRAKAGVPVESLELGEPDGEVLDRLRLGLKDSKNRADEIPRELESQTRQAARTISERRARDSRRLSGARERVRRLDAGSDKDSSVDSYWEASETRIEELEKSNASGDEDVDARGYLGQAGKQLNVSTMERQLRSHLFLLEQDPAARIDLERSAQFQVPQPVVGDEGLGRAGFRERYGVNPFVDTIQDSQSTFAMDVDTASFDRAMRELRSSRLPQTDSVRVEEFVNAVPVAPAQVDPTVDRGERADFVIDVDGGPAPFGPAQSDLMRVVVRARQLEPSERRRAQLTFAIDASGSMAEAGRLDRVRSALTGLVQQLEPSDRVQIVVYANEARVCLTATPARDLPRIERALEDVVATGPTNLEAGIDLAYRVAGELRDERSADRVILVTDGVATTGDRTEASLVRRVEEAADRGIFLTIVGVGGRRYDDALLEKLSGRGNGQYLYAANERALAQVFREQLPSEIDVLAEDAKIQVTFDPGKIESYRLLGYENRDIADRDFRNDSVDAGEVPPGRTVTALYEVLRVPGASGTLATVAVRYRSTLTERIVEQSFDVLPSAFALELDDTSPEFQLIAAHAEFAELLRQSYWARGGDFSGLLEFVRQIPDPGTPLSAWKQQLAQRVETARNLTIDQLMALVRERSE